MRHGRTKANSPSSVRGFSESPAEEVLRRRIREERESRDWTQQDLAEGMTEAGSPMTHDTISKIESGARRIYHGEAVLFAGVLEVPFVRLSSPLEGEEVAVRVDPRRPALRPIELRNWFVYGHRWTPAHQDAQHGMQFAQAAYARLRPRDERQRRVAGKRLVELLRRR
jgi:transcriptional regulator with XRE-family HTH domain